MSAAFDPVTWRPAPFLPARDARDPALLFVVAVLCFLACLTALGVIAADNLSPQKARVLLMLGLAVTSDVATLRRMFAEY